MTHTIGEQLRSLRTERGLTQETLAASAGVSVDIIKKLEQGQRESARLSTLTALANALDVSLAALTDKRPHLDGPGDRLVLNIRDALLGGTALDILNDDEPEPVSLSKISADIHAAWQLYWGGKFVRLARLVPELIGEARATYRSTRTRDAASALAQANQLAACLLVHLGRDDLAAVGAERAIAVVDDADDELRRATLYGTYCWVLLSQGRNDMAYRLAEKVAGQIEPRMSTADQQHLTVWGGMVLWALAAACAGDAAHRSDDLISLARSGAVRMPRDRHDYNINFGPSQVAMQATHAYAVLEQPDRALAAAQDVHRRDLLVISYGSHLLDVAQAHVFADDYEDAVGALSGANAVAPVWFRHQTAARALVGELSRARRRPSSGLRALISTLSSVAA